jgi:hypothetical protein
MGNGITECQVNVCGEESHKALPLDEELPETSVCRERENRSSGELPRGHPQTNVHMRNTRQTQQVVSICIIVIEGEVLDNLRGRRGNGKDWRQENEE